MRKLMSILLTLALLLSVPAAQAYTTHELPYARYTLLSALELTYPQQELAEIILRQIDGFNTDISLPSNALYEDVKAAMRSVTQDYPELFHLKNEYPITYYRDKPEYAEALFVEYTMTPEAYEEALDNLIATSWLILDSFEHDDYIQQRLCLAASFRNEQPLDATAYGAIIDGYANCEGYAKAYALLCRMRGVPCGVITGTARTTKGDVIPHAWNIAWMNDEYTLVDVTWDDQDALGLDTWWYYGLSTAQMGVDHFPDAWQVIPECGDRNNWHVNRGFLITNEEEAKDALRWVPQQAVVNLRITDPELYARIADGSFYPEFLTDNPHFAQLNPCALICCEAQQCVVFIPYPD